MRGYSLKNRKAIWLHRKHEADPSQSRGVMIRSSSRARLYLYAWLTKASLSEGQYARST